MSLRGVIFDLDGTLADTLPVCYAAFREVLRDHLARDFGDAEIRTLFGPSEEGIFRRLVPADWASALSAYLAAYAKLHPQLGRRLPGIDSLLQMLSERGIAAAVVTGKGPGSASISLGALGLAHLFDIVEAGSPGGPVKPESIRRVMTGWGFEPQEICYVGDSAYDVRSARETGVRAIAAAWAPGTALEPLRDAEPDQLFVDVRDFAKWIITAI